MPFSHNDGIGWMSVCYAERGVLSQPAVSSQIPAAILTKKKVKTPSLKKKLIINHISVSLQANFKTSCVIWIQKMI
jgi:hypothetical protein